MFAPLIDTRSHARCMGNYLRACIRSHRNGNGKFFPGNCMCVHMCVRNLATKWHQILLKTGKGTLAGRGHANNRVMDPFTLRLPVQIQGRFVVNKSHYTLGAIQRSVW